MEGLFGGAMVCRVWRSEAGKGPQSQWKEERLDARSWSFEVFMIKCEHDVDEYEIEVHLKYDSSERNA